jgi:hypothetical protein
MLSVEEAQIDSAQGADKDLDAPKMHDSQAATASLTPGVRQEKKPGRITYVKVHRRIDDLCEL